LKNEFASRIGYRCCPRTNVRIEQSVTYAQFHHPVTWASFDVTIIAAKNP